MSRLITDIDLFKEYNINFVNSEEDFINIRH